MTLSLPIVVGKKYVRRDGKIVITREPSTLFGPNWTYVGPRSSADTNTDEHAKITTGLVWTNIKSDADLVSDYIEPAKGHPHAALMMEFAKDAAETETPWERWELLQSGGNWVGCGRGISFDSRVEYRRKPPVTPDPHAENAAEYAKDMAETDKAWERWEFLFNEDDEWQDCQDHPSWTRSVKFRRKEQA